MVRFINYIVYIGVYSLSPSEAETPPGFYTSYKLPSPESAHQSHRKRY
ncbi:hypothetical protein HG1285_06370 [Hydrogenivirga sp. 128-5-R1-1]|nr:hypothetical protein HG1285_06370 [Hydrogenivirga sp. 128-5-R1-1]